MRRIGVISDTHNCFDEPLCEFLRDVDEIWHAGDIGSIELADEIAAFKPLRAVYGNIDGGDTRYTYSDFTYFQVEEVTVLMTHIGGYPRHYSPQALARIQRAHPKIFVAGHSHILRVEYDKVYDMLHINPGAAGTYGFHKVRTALRFTIDGSDIRDMELWELERQRL
jgi:putative phosphoesterase